MIIDEVFFPLHKNFTSNGLTLFPWNISLKNIVNNVIFLDVWQFRTLVRKLKTLSMSFPCNSV